MRRRLHRRLISLLAGLVLVAGAFVATSTPAEAACGSPYVRGPHWNKSNHTTWVSGGVSNSCAGWTKYCVTLYHTFLAGAPYPTPKTIPRQQRCANLVTGRISGSSTPANSCYPGYWWGRMQVFKGSTVVVTKETKLYDYGLCY